MAGVGLVRRPGQEEDKEQAMGPSHLPPVIITLPDLARRRIEMFPSPLVWECEEDAGAMRTRKAWQVHAAGGFIVLTWFWARWKERKNRGTSKPNGD